MDLHVRPEDRGLMTTCHPTTRADWRSWLAAHHDRETEIWLVYNKRHTGEPRVEYDESGRFLSARSVLSRYRRDIGIQGRFDPAGNSCLGPLRGVQLWKRPDFAAPWNNCSCCSQRV